MCVVADAGCMVFWNEMTRQETVLDLWCQTTEIKLFGHIANIMNRFNKLSSIEQLNSNLPLAMLENTPRAHPHTPRKEVKS